MDDLAALWPLRLSACFLSQRQPSMGDNSQVHSINTSWPHLRATEMGMLHYLSDISTFKTQSNLGFNTPEAEFSLSTLFQWPVRHLSSCSVWGVSEHPWHLPCSDPHTCSALIELIFASKNSESICCLCSPPHLMDMGCNPLLVVLTWSLTCSLPFYLPPIHFAFCSCTDRYKMKSNWLY